LPKHTAIRKESTRYWPQSSADPLIPELVGSIEAILAHDLDTLKARAAYPQTRHQHAQGRQADIVD